MIKKIGLNAVKTGLITQRNTCKLLSSRHIMNEKSKFYQDEEETIKMKVKFILKQSKYTLIEGCKDLKRDTQWLIHNIKTKRNRQMLTGYEIKKRRRVTHDLLKFIPYSIILAVPAAEICLPLILWLFPEAIASFFMLDSTLDKRIKKLEKDQ